MVGTVSLLSTWPNEGGVEKIIENMTTKTHYMWIKIILHPNQFLSIPLFIRFRKYPHIKQGCNNFFFFQNLVEIATSYPKPKSVSGQHSFNFFWFVFHLSFLSECTQSLAFHSYNSNVNKVLLSFNLLWTWWILPMCFSVPFQFKMYYFSLIWLTASVPFSRMLLEYP